MCPFLCSAPKRPEGDHTLDFPGDEVMRGPHSGPRATKCRRPHSALAHWARSTASLSTLDPKVTYRSPEGYSCECSALQLSVVATGSVRCLHTPQTGAASSTRAIRLKAIRIRFVLLGEYWDSCSCMMTVRNESSKQEVSVHGPLASLHRATRVTPQSQVSTIAATLCSLSTELTSAPWIKYSVP